MPTLLQIDFPAEGPWGDEMTAAYDELARTIAQAPGLRWKLWTESRRDGIAGGIYLFDDEASARDYLKVHIPRLQSFGVTGIRGLIFDVNEGLSVITRGSAAGLPT
ncbi:monooxygenase [Rhodococcus chondri]|uniref:Monooxygenase n=1 Tax=Rhodococcus chondri TaxID=3065941 RepID=A0ABU7JMC6_9NOCA|nr:monooxygenase [Rhodococcus sp. CC-R104]MEE2031188.1 monooxygenase [Rhodococcus sp. CC-R104]